MTDKPKISRSLRKYFSELGKRSAAKLTRKEQLERAANARRGRSLKRQQAKLDAVNRNNAKIRAKFQQEAPEISQEPESAPPAVAKAPEVLGVVKTEPAIIHQDLAVNRPIEKWGPENALGTPEESKGTPAEKNMKHAPESPAVVHQDLTTENFFTIKAPRPMRIR